MKVYVVTSTEMGWDCVVGVFTNVSEAQLQKIFPENSCFVITERKVEQDLTEYEPYTA